MAFKNLLTVDSRHAHLAMVNRLAQTAQSVVAIAGNGMCSSGRIVNYLKAMLHDPHHDVLFDGHQAEGSTGRKVQRFGKVLAMWKLTGSAMIFEPKCIS